MSARHGRSWWTVGLIAAFATGCNDSNGPQAHLANPQQLSADLQTVSAVFASSAFQSFGAIGTATGSPAAVSTRAGALLAATPIVAPRTSTEPYADVPRRLQALRAGAGAFRSGIAASVIPAPLLGSTFVWDVTNHTYVVDASATPAAPANGVRIILYATANGTIVESPLTAVGFVDLVDQSSGSTNALEVTVKGRTPASPGTTYVQYTVSATVTGTTVVTAFNASATGFVSDGTNTLSFDATFAATGLDTDNPDVDFHVTWDLDNPVIHVSLHETVTTPDANQATLTIDFSVTHGTETVSVTGTIVVVLSPQTVTANLAIDVNGVPFAKVVGTNNGITLRHADGSTLAVDEVQAVSDLFSLPDSLQIAIDNLFNPAQHLMGG